MDLEQLLDLNGVIALWGPFGLLILCGLGLPVPEDIILVAAGYLGADNDKSLLTVIVVMYFGIMIGDSLVYFLGRKLGRGVLSTRMGKYVITAERLVKAEEMFKRYGTGVVFFGRFLPGLRAAIFFSAGVLRFSVFRFWAMDGLAALISAPLFVWLGHWACVKYSDDLDSLLHAMGQTKLYLGIVLAIVLVVVIFVVRLRAKKSPSA